MPMKDFYDVRIDLSGVDRSINYPLDRNLIHAAISNLVLNALQSSPPHATVEVRAAMDRVGSISRFEAPFICSPTAVESRGRLRYRCDEEQGNRP